MAANNETKIKELATRIREGDEAAFREFYDLYFDRIFRFLMTILRNPDDAEDVTSTAFIYVWDSRERLQKPELLVSWAYQVAKHRAFDLIRKNKTATSPLEDALEVADGRESAETQMDGFYSKQFADSLLKNLSEDERVLIHLSFAEGLNSREIGERLDITGIAVRVRLHRTIKKLQGILKENADESGLVEIERFSAREIYD